MQLATCGEYTWNRRGGERSAGGLTAPPSPPGAKGKAGGGAGVLLSRPAGTMWPMGRAGTLGSTAPAEGPARDGGCRGATCSTCAGNWNRLADGGI